MFTIFHLLEIIGIVIGLVLGIKIGYNNFGGLGLIVGALLVAFAGLILGRIPFWLGYSYLQLELKRSDSESLRKRLKKDPFISHLIIAELAKRGEFPEEE